MVPDIPDYQLLRIIGTGSYGEVWLARTLTGIHRAIKIVWRQRFTAFQPYEREFEGLKRFAQISLTESCQLAILHVGRNRDAGYFYYVMELADDMLNRLDFTPDLYVPHTLKAARTNRPRIPISQAIALGTMLAEAVANLHAIGLVHRDIKASNIIFVRGAPKLADIGLVSIVGELAEEDVGTPGYVPPEGHGKTSADVFSLGKLLYEISTGLDRTHYPRLPPDVSAVGERRQLLRLNDILIKACHHKVDRRYADAAEMLQALLKLQNSDADRRRFRTGFREMPSLWLLATGLLTCGTALGFVLAGLR